MKIHSIQTIIAMAISLLISYGLYSYHSGENKTMLCLGSFVFMATSLAMTIGASFESPRTTINIRVVSGIFFFIALSINLFYLFQPDFSKTSYIIFNGIPFLIFALLAVSLNKKDV